VEMLAKVSGCASKNKNCLKNLAEVFSEVFANVYGN
jgi:hypothetical protein